MDLAETWLDLEKALGPWPDLGVAVISSYKSLRTQAWSVVLTM